MAKGKLGIREPDNFARGVIVVNVATPVTLLRETYTVFRQQRAHFSGVERPYSRTEVYVRGTKLGRKSFATPSPPPPSSSSPLFPERGVLSIFRFSKLHPSGESLSEKVENHSPRQDFLFRAKFHRDYEKHVAYRNRDIVYFSRR